MGFEACDFRYGFGVINGERVEVHCFTITFGEDVDGLAILAHTVAAIIRSRIERTEIQVKKDCMGDRW